MQVLGRELLEKPSLTGFWFSFGTTSQKADEIGRVVCMGCV